MSTLPSKIRASVARVCTSNQAPSCPVRDAVEIAADANHAVAGDPALEPQHRSERGQRQRTQVQSLLGERLADDPARGRMQTRVSDAVEPAPQLVVEVGQVAELRARKKSSRI